MQINRQLLHYCAMVNLLLLCVVHRSMFVCARVCARTRVFVSIAKNVSVCVYVCVCVCACLVCVGLAQCMCLCIGSAVTCR